jgi:hypothetical protein
MSALRPKADIDRRDGHVRLVPIASERSATNRVGSLSTSMRGCPLIPRLQAQAELSVVDGQVALGSECHHLGHELGNLLRHDAEANLFLFDLPRRRRADRRRLQKRENVMAITAFQWEDGPNHTQRAHPLGDRNDQNSKRNGCSGWLARWRAPDLSICTARGNRSTARCLHGGRPDVVQLGDSEQGTHSDLLGVEDGPAYAEVPGSVCQALTSRRFDLYVAERNWDPTSWRRWHVRLVPKRTHAPQQKCMIIRSPHWQATGWKSEW